MTNEIMIILSLLLTLIFSITLNIVKEFSLKSTLEDFKEERKDLLNRIMSKDLADYKEVNNPLLPKGKNPMKKLLEEEFKGYYE